ncbi:MAG: tRNA1(Val) (adenine(37)-N6)-methyltransferase [Lachnospiraceae bacterium]|nr:tRNA1(Val) (adenine(37)-N6)-methyltransferase [Lachnospiraceae bacterium]
MTTDISLLKEGERIDDLERNGLSIIQDPSSFCFGMDAVLLTGFASVPDDSTVVDLGTGTGIIPILLSAKTKARRLTGLEIQEKSADMAQRSVALNKLGSRIDIIKGDIREADRIFASASFDVVVSNPPYMVQGSGLQNPNEAIAIAKHELLCDLSDVIRAAAYVLKEGGIFNMVHRPFRLADLIETMRKYRIEPKRMKFVFPSLEREPVMVLIEGRKGGGANLTVEKPLIIYGPDGKYTEEITEIYGY